jgi:membrane protease YdiL (CAAX protease family)
MGKKKDILYNRFRFFIIEVLWLFLIIFILYLIPAFLIPVIVSEDSLFYGLIFYLFRALLIFIAVPISLTISNFLSPLQKEKLILEEDISPIKGQLLLYKITEKNYKYQILYGFLILFLVFLPLDILGYLFIPGMIKYQASIYSNQSTGIYLTEEYFIFLLLAFIIQFSISFYEESISRGFITKRGSENFNGISAVIISSVYFGLGHFAYFLFAPQGESFSISYPLIWFTESFFIGIILSLLIVRKKWILPAIIAHALNNIISTHTIWNYLQGNSFEILILVLYLPLLIIAACLFVWFYPKIKEGILIGLKMLKDYFKFNTEIGDSRFNIIFRIFIDLLIGSLIFLIGVFIAI